MKSIAFIPLNVKCIQMYWVLSCLEELSFPYDSFYMSFSQKMWGGQLYHENVLAEWLDKIISMRPLFTYLSYELQEIAKQTSYYSDSISAFTKLWLISSQVHLSCEVTWVNPIYHKFKADFRPCLSVVKGTPRDSGFMRESSDVHVTIKGWSPMGAKQNSWLGPSRKGGGGLD